MSNPGDFIIENGVLKKFKSRSGEVIIPEGVTEIGSGAFSGCARVNRLTIPGSVRNIGSKAFSDCTGLAKLEIPEGVETIGENAFRGCRNLTTLDVPASLRNIDSEAFYGCKSLTEVHIHDLAAWCGVIFGSDYRGTSNPFSNGGKLYLDRELITDLVIPEGVTHIERAAFSGCTSLKSVTFPASLKSIGDDAFEKCGRKTSGSQTVIMWYEMRNCGSLEKVCIRDLKAWLGIRFGRGNSNPLMNGCKLCINGEIVTELRIPEGITQIPPRAFIGCSSLTEVTIPESVTDIGMEAFRACSSLKSVTIPESVTGIGDSAFAWCESLKNMTIPSQVQSIGN